jgi:hypothetical protein
MVVIVRGENWRGREGFLKGSKAFFVAILPFPGFALLQKVMEWFRYYRKSFNEAAIEVCEFKELLKFL